MPIKLKPGKNEVAIGTDEMVNVNGSTPNLANVTRWYIVDVDRKGPTLYFGDGWLEGADAPAQSSPGAPSGPQPLVGYKIKGKVGDLNVDLTITPFVVPGLGLRRRPLCRAIRRGKSPIMRPGRTAA